MSLNVLKWVYNLGIQQERRRIAAYLNYQQVSAQNRVNGMHNSFREGSGRVTHSEEIDLAVESRVADMLSELFRSQGQMVQGESIMFPEEDK